jgi:hypothetical protein
MSLGIPEREVRMCFTARFFCRLFILLLFFPLVSTPASGKTIEMASHWVQQPLKIDGVRADWPDRSILFFNDQEIFIGACNDSTNLYLILHFRNPDWARLIRRGGLTVYLDAAGKKGKDFKLQFTGGPTMKEIMAVSGTNAAGGTDRMRGERDGRMRGGNDTIENPFLCYQKEYLTEKAIPMDGGEGPAVAGALDQEFFVYEFSVPLRESTVKAFGLGTVPGKTIGVGFVWGEMNMKKRPEGMSGDMGDGGFPGGGGGGMPSGGGRGGGPGGGPGGGHGGGPMGGNRQEKQEIWVKVQLADPNQESSVSDK